MLRFAAALSVLCLAGLVVAQPGDPPPGNFPPQDLFNNYQAWAQACARALPLRERPRVACDFPCVLTS